MSPSNAEIVVLEDKVGYRETMKQFLEDGGHTVVAMVGTLEEFNKLLEQDVFSDLRRGVVITDGSLSGGDYTTRDGEEAIAMIRRKYPNNSPIIIGRSLNQPVPGADYQMTKSGVGSAILSSEIDKL